MTKHTPGPWRIGNPAHMNANRIEGQSGKIRWNGDDGWRTLGTFQPCTSSDDYEEEEANGEANGRLIAAAPQLAEALRAIVSTNPEPFSFPSDWSAQVAACPECKRYETHPIQQGICDEHRRPLWAREKHDLAERAALGGRMRSIAEAALKAAGVEP